MARRLFGWIAPKRGENVIKMVENHLELTKNAVSSLYRLVESASEEGDDTKKLYDSLSDLEMEADDLRRKMVDELTKYGVGLKSITEPFDTANAAGKMMLQMLGVFAEFEHATIVERTKVGMERKAKSGKFVGGYVPYGYQIDSEKGLVAHEEEAFIVRKMFKMYSLGKQGASAICSELNGAGYRNRNGRKWGRRVILYMREMRNNVKTQKPLSRSLFRRTVGVVSASQVGPGEVGPVKIGPVEIRRTEFGLTEIRADEASPTKFHLANVGPTEIGQAQVSPAEARSSEVGKAKVGKTQVHPTKVGLTQDRLAQVCFAEIRSYPPILLPPPIPNLYPLLENFEMFFFGHLTISPIQNSSFIIGIRVVVDNVFGWGDTWR